MFSVMVVIAVGRPINMFKATLIHCYSTSTADAEHRSAISKEPAERRLDVAKPTPFLLSSHVLRRCMRQHHVHCTMLPLMAVVRPDDATTDSGCPLRLKAVVRLFLPIA